MSRRSLFLLLSLGVALPTSGRAEDLTPEQLASIHRDEQKALDQVSAAHGNKPSSELSSSERRQLVHEQQEASRKVLEAHGVSAKDYARQTARMGPQGNEQVATAEKALEAQEKAAQKKKPAGNGEIQVQLGVDENHPVTLEEQEGAAPVVEQGLPPEEQAAMGVEQGAPSEESVMPAAPPPKAAKLPKAPKAAAKSVRKKKQQ